MHPVPTLLMTLVIAAALSVVPSAQAAAVNVTHTRDVAQASTASPNPLSNSTNSNAAQDLVFPSNSTIAIPNSRSALNKTGSSVTGYQPPMHRPSWDGQYGVCVYSPSVALPRQSKSISSRDSQSKFGNNPAHASTLCIFRAHVALTLTKAA
ncbi:hypothetical protein BCR44DRAFT_398412 [Catenaria anguillulae PL171]|uniref:Uncharacterized protein n=1 Tax=Catenaria anguillulae PL171 TaxID=765915 RepID=A0A1Y2I0M3_9FUNG|nr:hypothetical protein BCR44DRAFT_398412 [Catenaria anguillulae PL171]